jgi:hypothetical protein
MSGGTQLVRPAAQAGGTDLLVRAGAPWSYLVCGTPPSPAWTEPTYNDSTWPIGHAQLRYGDGDEVTLIGFGSSSSNKFITTWFRHKFQVADANAQGELVLRLLRDDGAAVFLNGVEAVRSNLAPGAGPGTTTPVATPNSTESYFYEYRLPASLLVSGENVVAVEVHQAAANSSDLGFDLELRRERYAGGVLGNDRDAESAVL